MKFLVFSDVHIGGKFNEEMFLKGVNLINSTDADYYIFSGDLTDQGTLQEYLTVTKKYLPMIKKPILLIPGNHDVKNVGDLLWEEYIGPRYFVYQDDENKVKILGLDSNEPDKNTGRIGEKGIKRIYEEFDHLGDDWTKVLVFHHQTLPIRYTGRERSAITDAGDVIKAILDCDVQLVINGHRHISNVYRLSDSDCTALVVNCGTMSCKKTRYKEEYSLTLIDFDPKDLRARVEVIELNDTPPTNFVKFDGSISVCMAPEKLSSFGERVARVIQIGNTEFSSHGFDGEVYAKMVSIVNLIDCDLVVHCGDITKDSYSSEFSMAMIYLGQLQHDLLVVPGPRDYRPLGYELFRRYFTTTNPEFENESIKALGVNSCILDEKIGRLGRSSLRRISNELAETNKISVVAFHHTIIPLARTKHESELEDAGDVLAYIVEKKINLVLTGAKNTSGCWRVGDTIFVNVGTASSPNVTSSKGNSFNIIDIYREGEWIAYKITEYFIASDKQEQIGRFMVKDHLFSRSTEQTC